MRIILLLIIIFFSLISSAQKSDHEFREFGKVSERDFQHTDLEDLGYDAVVLQNEKKMYFDIYNEQLRLYNVFHIRLKALKDGFKDNDIFTVNYSGRFNYEHIHMVKCWIFTNHGSKISHKKLKYKDFNHYDRDSLESRMSVSLPEIHSGDIIDFEYTLITFNFILPPIWNFNCKYPCVASRLITRFPEFMQYKYDCKGAFANDIQHSSGDEFISMIYNYTPQDNPNSMNYMSGPTRKISVVYKFLGRLDTFKVTRAIPTNMFEDKHISHLYGTAAIRMRASKFTQNIGYYGLYYTAWQQLTHLIYTYADPDNRDLSQNEAWHKSYNAGYVLISSDNWLRLHKRQRKSREFWKPLVKMVTMPPELSELSNPDEILDTLAATQQIFEYVRQNIAWDSSYDNHIRHSIDHILRLQRGSSADVNMALVSLLKHIGIDAYTVMASTIDYGEVDTAYANTVQFNTVLAGVPYENYLILMDATDRHTPFRQIPDMHYDRVMWALSPDTMFFVELDNAPDGSIVAKKMSE